MAEVSTALVPLLLAAALLGRPASAQLEQDGAARSADGRTYPE